MPKIFIRGKYLKNYHSQNLIRVKNQKPYRENEYVRASSTIKYSVFSPLTNKIKQ